MVTTIKLHNGVLTTRRERRADGDRRRLAVSIRPAVAFLRSRGGGCFYVVSR